MAPKPPALRRHRPGCFDLTIPQSVPGAEQEYHAESKAAAKAYLRRCRRKNSFTKEHPPPGCRAPGCHRNGGFQEYSPEIEGIDSKG